MKESKLDGSYTYRVIEHKAAASLFSSDSVTIYYYEVRPVAPGCLGMLLGMIVEGDHVQHELTGPPNEIAKQLRQDPELRNRVLESYRNPELIAKLGYLGYTHIDTTDPVKRQRVEKLMRELGLIQEFLDQIASDPAHT